MELDQTADVYDFKSIFLNIFRKRLQRLDDSSESCSVASETETGFQIPRPEISGMGLFRGDNNWTETKTSFTNPSFEAPTNK